MCYVKQSRIWQRSRGRVTYIRWDPRFSNAGGAPGVANLDPPSLRGDPLAVPHPGPGRGAGARPGCEIGARGRQLDPPGRRPCRPAPLLPGRWSGWACVVAWEGGPWRAPMGRSMGRPPHARSISIYINSLRAEYGGRCLRPTSALATSASAPRPAQSPCCCSSPAHRRPAHRPARRPCQPRRHHR